MDEEIVEIVEKKEEKVAPKAVPPARPAVQVEPTMHFDDWYASRKKAIPDHHHKEIILADFKARGVPSEAKASEFDSALGKYGIKLG